MSTCAVVPKIAALVGMLSSAQGPMLQRSCRCGQHTHGSECEKCKKGRLTLQRSQSSQEEVLLHLCRTGEPAPDSDWRSGGIL
jgi:hypothetical protein